MYRVLASVYRLTGLLHPEWALRVGAGGDPPRRERGERGVKLSGERRRGRIEGGVPIQEAVRCTYDEARLEGPVLAGDCALTRLRFAVIQRPRALPGARLSACDLEGAEIEDGDLVELTAAGCALREAGIRRTRLGTLELCDLFGARLQAVRLERARASDFGAAVLSDCDLSGADLRGSSFRGAELKGCDLTGARVEGADFAGARGLDRQTRRALLAGGARFQGAALTAALTRAAPGADPQALERLAAGLRLGAIALGILLSLGATALVLTPPAPPASPTVPPALQRTPTAQERERTREALAAIRANLARAHKTMLDNGATDRSWPTIVEFQENRFDLDGDASGEVHDRLFPGGLPDNYLTDVQGSVLPYCNDVPEQETLSGVDADWHYCELTGRVFASAGWSGEATLNW